MLDHPPRVLFFDTFGTVVEWRSSVTKALSDAARQVLDDPNRDLPVDVRQRTAALNQADWLAFAEEWRLSYNIFTRTFDPSKEFVSVDQHHYHALQDLLQQRGIRKLFDDSQLLELTMCWHRLTPWPDSVAGLDLLNTKFITSTLSNGNESLLQDLKEAWLTAFYSARQRRELWSIQTVAGCISWCSESRWARFHPVYHGGGTLE